MYGTNKTLLVKSHIYIYKDIKHSKFNTSSLWVQGLTSCFVTNS